MDGSKNPKISTHGCYFLSEASQLHLRCFHLQPVLEETNRVSLPPGRKNHGTPWKINMEPKKTPNWKGKSSSKPSFSGSMLIFQVAMKKGNSCFCCFYKVGQTLCSIVFCWWNRLVLVYCTKKTTIVPGKMFSSINPKIFHLTSWSNWLDFCPKKQSETWICFKVPWLNH